LLRPAPRALPDDAAQALDALLTRRRQVLEMPLAERKRLEHAVPAVRRGITQHIRWLERQLDDVDRDCGFGRDGNFETLKLPLTATVLVRRFCFVFYFNRSGPRSGRRLRLGSVP